MKQISVINFLLICSSFFSYAQPDKPAIKVLAKVSPDGVWLRWAPTDATLWKLGNLHGYKIDRYVLNADGSLSDSGPIRLHEAPVKPLPQKEFESLEQVMPESGVVRELIYESENSGSTSEVESPSGLLKKNEELQNRFGMALLVCDLSPMLARAAGLFFKDSTSVKEARYIYKISLAVSKAKITVDPGVIVVDVIDSKPLRPFTDLQSAFGDRTVTLSWSTATHVGVYTGYLVEKSRDGKIFKTITDLPYIPMSESIDASEAHFVDSLENNTATFYYRVIGISPFGEKSPPSNEVSGSGKDTMTGLLILRDVNRTDKNKVNINWEFPAAFETKISGFIVEKSARAEGPYEETRRVVNKELRAFTEPAPVKSAYYMVNAIDAQGKIISNSLPYFFHVEDNIPPGVPAGLSGKISEKGIVTLSWKPVSDQDIQGYRVFCSHDLSHEFIEVTAHILISPEYADTVNIRVLNKKIYYKIVAVDDNFNTSEYSQPLVLYKPDIIAPAAPVFGKIERKKNAIAVRWINSNIDDVASYKLFRIIESDSVKIVLAQWRANQPKNEFEDNSIAPGKTYRYLLTVYDSSGNVGTAYSKAISVESRQPKAVDDISALIDREKKQILLKWKYNEIPRKCLIFKRRSNEPFTLFQTLDGSIWEFTDDNVLINTTYFYKVQLVLEKNIRTELSRELKVPF